MEKVALVTGGGRGIGRGVTLQLAEAGYAVVANYRQDSASAESLQAEIRGRGGKCEIVQGVPINDFSRAKIDASVAELKEEKSLVSELIS